MLCMKEDLCRVATIEDGAVVLKLHKAFETTARRKYMSYSRNHC